MIENKKIACIAVDDDPAALELLNSYISTVPFLQLYASFTSTIDVLPWLKENSTSLLFIEFNMPILSGNQLVTAIKNPPKIILTGSNEKDASEAFELGAIDFLLKPFSFERFIKAINKIIGPKAVANGSDLETLSTVTLNDFRYFKTERKMVKVNFDDILFIESIKDYIKVVTKTGTVVTRKSISSMESILPKHLFFRIHRSYIVSFKYIDCFTSERIEISKYSLPVSRPYRHEMENRLK